jgi:hypothetical protein
MALAGSAKSVHINEVDGTKGSKMWNHGTVIGGIFGPGKQRRSNANC